MQNFKENLPHYSEILKGETKARYLQCKTITVLFDKNESTEILWKKHNTALQKQIIPPSHPKQNLLDLKIELASRIFQECVFCEHKCKINRKETSGECGVKNSKIASEFLHQGEEYFLVPSHTIFFSGCSFHCIFCQNHDISQHQCGISLNTLELSKTISERKKQGAKNVNWVGGDPTSHLYYILTVLKKCNENIAQIWNSNMYCSLQTMYLLHGVIDLYLSDFKYGNDACAQRLSKISNYSAITKRNHIIAAKQTDLLIRHLILPHHSICCSTPLLYWIHTTLPHIPIHLMAQYRPMYQSKNYEDVNCFLCKDEYEYVIKTAEALHLTII